MDEQPDPDTKDWTWVLGEACAECGFDTRDPARSELSGLSRELGALWIASMAVQESPATRPRPRVWSPLEYACHVRDVFELASFRVRLMLAEDDPRYPNWDQDATAIEDDYAAQQLTDVMPVLQAAAEEFADVLDGVPADAWGRTGLRGDGSAFTIESFARYLLHDPVHHLTDVTGQRWPAVRTLG